MRGRTVDGKPRRQTRWPRARPPQGRPQPPLEAQEEPELAGEFNVREGVEVMAALWEE